MYDLGWDLKITNEIINFFPQNGRWYLYVTYGGILVTNKIYHFFPQKMVNHVNLG
jgi:hypothetical protein